MVLTTNQIIKIIKSHISSDLELVILYGSAASDRLTKKSDIDIAIGSNKLITNDFALEFSLKLTHLLDREVSVIDISKMEGVILKEVLVKGVTLKNLDPLLKAKYITKMITYCQDILPYQIQSFNNKLKEFLINE